MIGAAEPGNPAHIGRRIGDTVGEHEPAAAVCKEGDVFAARPFEIDDPVADLGDAAGDHAEDIDQAGGAACEQRAAGIDHAAADQQRTAVCQDRARIDKQPVDLGRAAASQDDHTAGGDNAAAAAGDREADPGAAGEDDHLAAALDRRHDRRSAGTNLQDTAALHVGTEVGAPGHEFRAAAVDHGAAGKAVGKDRHSARRAPAAHLSAKRGSARGNDQPRSPRQDGRRGGAPDRYDFLAPQQQTRHGHTTGRVQDAAAADGSAKIDAAGGDIHGATGADRGSDVGAAAENEQLAAATDGDDAHDTVCRNFKDAGGQDRPTALYAAVLHQFGDAAADVAAGNMTLTHYHHGTGSQRQAGHILAAVEQFERAAAAHDAASAARPEHLQESAAENRCACHGAAGLHLQERAGLDRRAGQRATVDVQKAALAQSSADARGAGKNKR